MLPTIIFFSLFALFFGLKREATEVQEKTVQELHCEKSQINVGIPTKNCKQLQIKVEIPDKRRNL